MENEQQQKTLSEKEIFSIELNKKIRAALTDILFPFDSVNCDETFCSIIAKGSFSTYLLDQLNYELKKFGYNGVINIFPVSEIKIELYTTII